jgi:glucose/arabinose dehydrogenase
MTIRTALALALLTCAAAVPAQARDSAPSAARATFGLAKFATGLRSPVYLTPAPGDKRLFVVEQEGTIRTVTKGGKVSRKPYADLRRYVSAGGERGLLSVAFHPKFASNGRLYVYFTNKQGNEAIWELRAAKGAASVKAGHRVLMTIDDPEGNHNGGQLQFGPDGMLYIGEGDGGGGGDQHGEHGNGQNPATLLGKLLRVDVDERTGNLPYGIPTGNPFAGRDGWRPEIWALGLRNPWRFSFDRANGDLWIADVGQNAFEEINHVKRGLAGANYGWRRYEARHDFDAGTPLAGGKLVSPVAEYPHSDGCSVTGGYVYRGKRIAGLSGRYVYADYCTGKMWTLAAAGGLPVDVSDVVSAAGAESIVSFGQDASGMLYVCSAEGTIFRFVAR